MVTVRYINTYLYICQICCMHVISIISNVETRTYISEYWPSCFVYFFVHVFHEISLSFLNII